MNNQQDLIGTTWKCPRCKEEIIVTKDGVTHSCPGYWIAIRLDQLWEIQQDVMRINKKTIYGK